jgi:hypothetical protein
MNILSLGKVIIKNIFFMQALTRKLGTPVRLTAEECEKVYEDLMADKMMDQKFALMCNIKTMSIDWHYNIEKFLKYKGQLDLTKFFMLLHQDFMEEYLKWGQATYQYAMTRTDLNLEPLNHCTRMTIPLKLANGKYYWVMQEAIALQLDENGKLVSHLNIYTVLNEMEGNENVTIVGRLYNNGFEVKEWTQSVLKNFFTRHSFDLTKEQERIVAVLHKNLEMSNADIAQALQKTKNTIDVQNKLIIAKARIAFSNHEFANIREVVRFLGEIGYFNEEIND